MHSAMAARNDTTVAVLMVPIKHLHYSNAVSCNAWYALLLEDSRRRSVLSAKALSMAKRHFEGAKPEVWKLSASSNTAAWRKRVLRPTGQDLAAQLETLYIQECILCSNP